MNAQLILLRGATQHWEGPECTGKDALLDLDICVCPQLAIELTVEVTSGASRRMRWVCGCCYRLFPTADRRNPSTDPLP